MDECMVTEDLFAFDVGEKVETSDSHGNWTGEGVIVARLMIEGVAHYDIEGDSNVQGRYCETEIDRG